MKNDKIAYNNLAGVIAWNILKSNYTNLNHKIILKFN
jgi:hypothetical protein